VLRVANEYMNLGLYQRALNVLQRTYPAVPEDQTEPGSTLPQNNPLVLYYAAFCKGKLGNDASRSWQAAAQLSPSLVFPSSAMDYVVLEAASPQTAVTEQRTICLGICSFKGPVR